VQHVTLRATVRALWPVLALIASFMPWLHTVSPARPGGMNVYQLNPLAWIWAGLDVGVAIVLMVRQHSSIRGWVVAFWALLGAGSLGVGVSSVIFVSVAGNISAALGAPNPVRLSYGAVLFVLITLLWTATAWIESGKRWMSKAD